MLSTEPFIIWLFGIPGSGKTSIARVLTDRLKGTIELLDSDELRERLTPNPDWSPHERDVFYRALWEIALRLYRHQVSTLIAASGGGVSLSAFQVQAPSNSFFIHVNCKLEEAFQRRKTGWYERATTEGADIRLPTIRVTSQGIANADDVEVSNKLGITAYEIALPERIDLEVDAGSRATPEMLADEILSFLRGRGIRPRFPRISPSPRSQA